MHGSYWHRAIDVDGTRIDLKIQLVGTQNSMFFNTLFFALNSLWYRSQILTAYFGGFSARSLSQNALTHWVEVVGFLRFPVWEVFSFYSFSPCQQVTSVLTGTDRNFYKNVLKTKTKLNETIWITLKHSKKLNTRV